MVFQLPLAQPSVVGLARYLEEDVSADGVCVSVLDQGRHHREDAVDVIGHPRLVIGTKHAHAVGCLVEVGDVAIGDREEIDTLIECLVDDLVVDVGEVPDVVDG